MIKTVNMKEVNEWLNVMSDPRDYSPVDMYWRFSGALAILEFLNVITSEDVNKWLDDYVDKYLSIDPCGPIVIIK